MNDPMSWSSLMRVVLSLGLVLAVLWLALRGVRRLQPGAGSGRADLRVVASLALAPRERLLLVQVGPQQLLLGAGPQGLRCLHVLPQALELPPSGPTPPFSDWLRKAAAAAQSTQSNQSRA